MIIYENGDASRMQFHRIWLGMIFCLVASFGAQAISYVGIDYNIRTMDGRDRKNYAMRLVLPNTYQGFEVYAAHRFENDVGLSLGWQQTGVSSRNHLFTAGEDFLGDPQSAGDLSSIQARVQALHLDLMGYINISENVEALGQIGVALMRVGMNGSIRANGVTSNLYPTRSFENLIPRFGLGLQYFPCQMKWCHLGLRVLVNWEATSLYNMSFVDDDGVSSNIKPFKSSWVYAFGIVGKF